MDHAGKGGDAGLTDTIPLRSLNVVAIRVPFVEQAREKVTIEMQTMVVAGLNALVNSTYLFLSHAQVRFRQNQPVLASSLQTGYNLRVLPELVQGLVFDLSDAVGERISSALDIAKISKEVFSNGNNRQLATKTISYTEARFHRSAALFTGIVIQITDPHRTDDREFSTVGFGSVVSS